MTEPPDILQSQAGPSLAQIASRVLNRPLLLHPDKVDLILHVLQGRIGIAPFHNFVGTEQLLLGVIGQRHGIGGRALAQLNITLKKTRKEIEKYIGRGTGFVASEIPFTPRAKRVLEMSIHEGQDLGVNYVGTEHVLLSLINEADGIAMRTLDKLKINVPKLRHLILTYIEEQQEDILKPPLTDQEKWAIARDKSGLQTPSLDIYSENITQEVKDQRVDPVIGRDEEINALVKVLGRRRKNLALGLAHVGNQ